VNADRGDAGNLERVTKHHAPTHPPCDEDCWAPLHDLLTHQTVGWVFTVPANEACRWDELQTRWIECKEHK
jgi:hypothetical protein